MLSVLPSLPFHLLTFFSGEKWFTFQHSTSRVCESCYQVYSELDKHRNTRLLAMYTKPKPLTTEEGRELEKKIFQQRKSCSKLSKLNRR